MKLTVYQIDAFTDKLFGGNPAAVIPLTDWLDDALMQQIALENNLSETVFFVPRPAEIIIMDSPDPLVIHPLVVEADPREYDIRWFTPEVEINLCGHATLASAYVLFNILEHPAHSITFHSKSGPLVVTRTDDRISMDFPAWKPTKLETTPEFLQEALGGVEVKEVHQYRDLLVVVPDEAAVQQCVPDFTLLKKHFDKLIITAAGESADFVSRFFAPGAGVDEDPVTGSAHSQLIPFWSERLNQHLLVAKQLSKRGGTIYCEQLSEERVLMSGHCVFYMKGEITLP